MHAYGLLYNCFYNSASDSSEVKDNMSSTKSLSETSPGNCNVELSLSSTMQLRTIEVPTTYPSVSRTATALS